MSTILEPGCENIVLSIPDPDGPTTISAVENKPTCSEKPSVSGCTIVKPTLAMRVSMSVSFRGGRYRGRALMERLRET